jgi:uncharacterized protein YrrD
MLRSVRSIIGYSVGAKDGNIGTVSNFYFDDKHWKIRYLVADTGGWLSDKKVLISPAAFVGKPQWDKKEFPVILTREMVKECPDIDTDKPVSRQKELELHAYYRWPVYWQIAEYGNVMPPVAPPPLPASSAEKVAVEEKGSSHLRSFREVTGYHIQARDGEIGHVDDFIIDDESLKIRYLAVNTRNWLPGRKVLIAPLWIKKVSWAEEKVIVGLTREQVKDSPLYDPETPVNREYEERLYDYYGRPKYWV